MVYCLQLLLHSNSASAHAENLERQYYTPLPFLLGLATSAVMQIMSVTIKSVLLMSVLCIDTEIDQGNNNKSVTLLVCLFI